VKAYPAETAEAFCDGHVAAFAFFGGVPGSILYDNTRLAVAKIVKSDGGRITGRTRSQMFAELQSHYLFDDRFGRPAKGNDKGKVEGLVGYSRRNFMTPLPVAESYEALNATLEDACRKRHGAILRGQTTSITDRMQTDIAAFMPLPTAPYDACHKVATRVTSLSLVRYRNNDYSVPTRFGHREVLVKGYVDRVEIACHAETIAVHARSYDTADFIYIRCIIWRCWNTRAGLWIRPLRLRAGFSQSVSIGCGVYWNCAWVIPVGASSSRCCA
jgi:hypothetical protein